MGRHERRLDLRNFRKASRASLLTYLITPDDAALDNAPLLKAATSHLLGLLSTRAQHCIVCSSWIVDRAHVGGVLLSTPASAHPTSAGTAAVCRECWEADLPIDALERAVDKTLRSVIPDGRLEPWVAPRWR